MAIPPIMLIPVIIKPAVASPFTNFVAPSIEPKKLFSCCNFFLLSAASLSVMAPVFRSESIAICLPAIASSVNRAVTSETRSVPLLITINWIIMMMIKIITPIIKLPPPTNSPNVSTTCPASPFFKISFVEDTFNEIRNNVVKSSMVGYAAISRTSFAYNVLNKIISAIPILIASIISNNHEGIEIMKNITAASRYKPMNKSFFFTLIIPFSFRLF